MAFRKMKHTFDSVESNFYRNSIMAFVHKRVGVRDGAPLLVHVHGGPGNNNLFF